MVESHRSQCPQNDDLQMKTWSLYILTAAQSARFHCSQMPIFHHSSGSLIKQSSLCLAPISNSMGRSDDAELGSMQAGENTWLVQGNDFAPAFTPVCTHWRNTCFVSLYKGPFVSQPQQTLTHLLLSCSTHLCGTPGNSAIINHLHLWNQIFQGFCVWVWVCVCILWWAKIPYHLLGLHSLHFHTAYFLRAKVCFSFIAILLGRLGWEMTQLCACWIMGMWGGAEAFSRKRSGWKGRD